MQCEKGKNLEPDEIITMDWLAENVIGKIPELDELTEEAQALVKFQGIKVDESFSEKNVSVQVSGAGQNGGIE